MSPNKKQVLRSSENVVKKARSHHDSTHKIKPSTRKPSRYHPIAQSPSSKHNLIPHPHQHLNQHPHPHPHQHPHQHPRPHPHPHPHHYQYYHHGQHQYYQHQSHHQPYHHPHPRPQKSPLPEEQKKPLPSLVSSSISLSSSSRPTQKQPKPPRSAFICFKDNKKKEIMKKQGIAKDNDDLLKIFASAWKSLSEKEKAYWDEEARNDKVRFVQEKATYDGPWNLPKRRAKKDPEAPKRPMSAFLKFSKTRRKKVKEENPDVSNTDVSRLLGEIWRNATEAEKAPYVEAEIVERNKYKEVMKNWREEKAQLDAAIRTSHETTSQIFRQNQDEQQKATTQSQGYASAFDRHRDFIPTIGAHFDRLHIEPLMEEESPSKRSAFRPHVSNHYHRPQHPGHEYFMSDSPNQHSWPDLSLQHSLDHDSDPLPVVPRMPHPLHAVKEEYNGGHQSNRSFYFPDNQNHFPRYP